MIVVGVRKYDRVESAWIEEKLAIQARRIEAIMIMKAAIQKNFVRSDLNQMRAAGDLTGRPMKCDPHPMMTPEDAETDRRTAAS